MMKFAGWLVVGLSVSASAGSAPVRHGSARQSSSADDHKAWMDDAGDAQEDAREALQAKDGAKVAAAAATIEALMAKTEAYWGRKNAADIVTLAQASRALARELGTSARAGRLDEAAAAFARMNATCNTCHDRHPEKR